MKAPTRDAVLNSAALTPRFRAHLRLLEPTIADAAFICDLRADPALNRHLSRSSPDIEAQRVWLEAYKEREAAGREFYFAVVYEGADVGVVRMYDFQLTEPPTSFAWGSWILPPPRPAGLVTFSALMIYEIGFDALGFDQAHFDVRKENAGVVDFHLRAGARQIGEAGEDLFFDYSPESYRRLKSESGGRYAQLRGVV